MHFSKDLFCSGTHKNLGVAGQKMQIRLIEERLNWAPSTLSNLSSGRLREVKNARKFQTFSSKSDRGRLRHVGAYKRFQI